MTNLELKNKIIEYVKVSSASLADKEFLIKYISSELNDDPDLELDLSDSSHKNILVSLCMFYNNIQQLSDSTLTTQRIKHAFDMLSQIDKLTDEELEDLEFEILKLNYSCGVGVSNSRSIIYKKVNKRF